MNIRIAFVLLLLTAALLTSCAGPGFSSAYRKSVDSYRAANPKPKVSGPWEGYWLSDKNQHTGKLRAIATPHPSPAGADDGFEHYDFRYHATWAKVLSGGYTSDHKVKRKPDGSFSVTGEKDIFLLGPYRSEGTVRGDKFDSRYHSSADQGVFILKRPSVE
jgi:hypothetical protein